MKTYIALLRGINVGGKNKISMSLLKAAFEEIGFSKVLTYINSGNVIFKSDETDKIGLIAQCENIISEKFGLNIPVCVVTSDEIAEALQNAPEWWDAENEVETVNQTIFLIPPVTASEVCKAVGDAKDKFEKVGYYNNVIFWSAARATFTKTRWSKIASSAVYSKVTIRNANTAKKLLALSSKL